MDPPRRPRTSALRCGWSWPSQSGRRLVRRLIEDVRLQECKDAFERIPPGLTLLPAVAFFVVPLDFVSLALDLEGLDQALGHERHDPLVLAAWMRRTGASIRSAR